MIRRINSLSDLPVEEHWFHDGTFAFVLPHATLDNHELHSGRKPKTIIGSPEFVSTRHGPAILFDEANGGGTGEAFNFGKPADRPVPTFPTGKTWIACCVFLVTKTSHDDGMLFGFGEAGSFSGDPQRILCRVDNGSAPVDIHIFDGAGGSPELDTDNVIEHDTWYCLLLDNVVGSGIRIHVFEVATGRLLDVKGPVAYVADAEADQAFFMGRSDGTESGHGNGDEFDGQIALFAYSEGGAALTAGMAYEIGADPFAVVRARDEGLATRSTTTGQTLVGTSISSLLTVSGGSLTPGPLNLDGNAISSLLAIANGSFSPGPLNLDGNSVSSLLSVSGGSLAPGGTSLVGNAIASLLAVAGGSFSPGGLSLVGGSVSSLIIVSGGSLTSGDQILAGNAIDSLLAVSGGSLTPGGISLAGGAISSLIITAAGGFLVGGATLDGNSVASLLSIGGGSLSPGGVSLAGNAVSALLAVSGGSLTPGGVSLEGGSIPSPFTVAGGTLGVVNITLEGNSIASLLTVSGGSLTPGAVSLVGNVIQALFTVQPGLLAFVDPTILQTPFDIEIPPEVYDEIQEIGKDIVFDVAGGVTVRVSPPLRFLQRFVRRTTVRHGRMLFIVPMLNLTFVPARGMLVTMDGVKGKITEVDPIPTGYTNAAYIIHVDFGGQTFIASARFTALDLEVVPEVLEAIDEHGIIATVTEVPLTSYNPITGVRVYGTPVVYSPKVTPPNKYEEGFVDGTLILEDDEVVYAAGSGLGFVPKEGRKLTLKVRAKNWKVIQLAATYTGEQVALWEFQLRR